MAFPKNTGSTTCVFGTEDVATDALASQLIESYNVEFTADSLEIKNNYGAVIGRFWFNESATGSFTLYFKSTGGLTVAEIGDVKIIKLKGTAVSVEITTESITKVSDAVEKRTYNFVYNSGISRA